MHRALAGNGGAHSAVEMALLDLIGRAAGKRLIDLVGQAAAQRREADVAARQPDRRSRRRRGARQAEAKASTFFKLKIGVKPLAKEIAIAHAVREALPKMPLCADANCGLTLAAAKTYIEKTRKAGADVRRAAARP